MLSLGILVKYKITAANAKAIAKMMYKMLIDEIEADSLSASPAMAFPNNNTLTKMGPIVVPNELILPAKFKRCEPVAGFPKFKINGLADVFFN
jgi:hypothetical protein